MAFVIGSFMVTAGTSIEALHLVTTALLETGAGNSLLAAAAANPIALAIFGAAAAKEISGFEESSDDFNNTNENASHPITAGYDYI